MAVKTYAVDQIFRLLNERGISQRELSKRTGISTSTISDWKTKGNVPTADKIVLVCEALNVSPEEILGKSVDLSEQRIVSKDEPLWQLVEYYDRLEKGEQERLLRYMMAIMKA